VFMLMRVAGSRPPRVAGMVTSLRASQTFALHAHPIADQRPDLLGDLLDAGLRRGLGLWLSAHQRGSRCGRGRGLDAGRAPHGRDRRRGIWRRDLWRTHLQPSQRRRCLGRRRGRLRGSRGLGWRGCRPRGGRAKEGLFQGNRLSRRMPCSQRALWGECHLGWLGRPSRRRWGAIGWRWCSVILAFGAARNQPRRGHRIGHGLRGFRRLRDASGWLHRWGRVGLAFGPLSRWRGGRLRRADRQTAHGRRLGGRSRGRRRRSRCSRRLAGLIIGVWLDRMRLLGLAGLRGHGMPFPNGSSRVRLAPGSRLCRVCQRWRRSGLRRRRGRSSRKCLRRGRLVGRFDGQRAEPLGPLA